MNPLGKLGNKIRYLTPDEQHYVINNIQPEGVDISELTNSIKNFKQNKLTLDFVHGLFDGDRGLSLSLSPAPKTKNNNKLALVSVTFTVVQDTHNLSLLEEVRAYFDGTGNIYEIKPNCSIFSVGSKSDLLSIVLPKMSEITKVLMVVISMI